MNSGLRLVVPDNFKDFGERVNGHLNLIRETDYKYIVNMELVRFNNGEGKCVMKESVRNQDV